jgi:soluble lytic murein transglycosylase
VNDRSYTPAVSTLKGSAPPLVADYAAFYLGLAEYELRHYQPAIASLREVYTHPVLSPMAARAVLLAAAAENELKNPKDAIALLRQHYKILPQASAEAALARSYEAAGDAVSAAVSWQRVYYQYPNSDSSTEAQSSLVRLKESLADKYPPPMGQMIMARAKALAGARRYAEAKKELESALGLLGGEERNQARVQIGVMQYQNKQIAPAYQYLRGLSLDSGEADAERLYHMVYLAKRLDREDEMNAHLKELDRKYPQSAWRLEAIISAAYLYASRNDQARYEALYKTCVESFPDSTQAAFCNWKLTWANYLRRPADSAASFQSHITRFPDSEKVPASLYFLGRLAEASRDFSSAKTYYTFLDYNYPNHYYAMLAQQKLETPAIHRATASASAQQFLESVPFPQKRAAVTFEASALSKQRIARARYLDGAGLADLAEAELRFAARNDGQPQVISVELARLLQKRGATDEALRAVKAYVPNYLNIPMDDAPLSFWRVAFPLPFRASLEKYARQKSLDPFVVAGLIRQESEFNPKAVSPAKAYGLTQVLPSTGRSLSRQNGIRRFYPKMLFVPDVNLKLGTHYLQQLLNSLNGKWEETLASYNAGRSRVMRWLDWGSYQEPAEFIESIPIAETRDYVQIVLRNASVYRRLYESTGAALPSRNVSSRGTTGHLVRN